MNIKVDFDNIVVKEDKNDFNVKVLMLKGEKGDAGDGEPNVIESVQVNGTALPVTNKAVNVIVPTVDSTLNSSSTNPVQNKTIYNALSNKVDTSELNNYYETSEVDDLLNQKANINDIDDDISKISKKTYYFNNVAEMKSYDLQEGDFVFTKGYYSANDGGSAKYIIKSSSSNYYETLNNSLVAELIISGTVTPEMFGAYGDNTHDDTLAIQTAINKSNNVLMNKTYNVTEIEVKGNVRLTGTINGDVKISTTNTNFDFNTINGELAVEGNGSLIQFVDVKGKRLTNESGNGLTLSANGQGIQYCNFSIELIRATNCINFVGGSSGGWINNNRFYKTNVSYGTGIVSTLYSGNNTYNANQFTEMGFEGLTKWFDLKSFSDAVFEKCRMSPFEADGQGSTIRELGVLDSCKTITFDNKATGTFYQFLTYTNSQGIILIDKVMSADGTKDASRMRLKNGSVESVEFDTPIFMKNMSELTGTTIIEIYNYDVSKPIIFNYDTSKYSWVNLRIPDAIANALKYVDIAIKGTSANSLDITRNNALLRSIPSGTANTTIRVYF